MTQTLLRGLACALMLALVACGAPEPSPVEEPASTVSAGQAEQTKAADAGPAAEDAPDTQAPPAPEPPPAPANPKGTANDRAQQYLTSGAYSREGLIRQLTFDGYGTDEAIAAADAQTVDWYDQARRKALSRLAADGVDYTYRSLVDRLVIDGFTAEQAAFGVANDGIDYQARATDEAIEAVQTTAVSRDGLVALLVERGYGDEQAAHAADLTGADWYAEAAEAAAPFVGSSYGHDGTVSQLLADGFTIDEAEAGVAAVGL